MQVTVVIATYGRDDELLDTVRSVLADHSIPSELLVVDQSERHTESVDAELRALHEAGRIRWFRVTPASLPAARNFGIAHSRGEVVVFVDDDVIVDSGFLRAHVEAHMEYPEAGAVAGRIREPGTPPTTKLASINRLGTTTGGWDWPAAAEVITARGCNMSFKRDVLEGVGGFDTRFTGNAYREESDLCMRVRRSGFTVRFEPRASLVHLEAPNGGCREDAPLHDGPVVYRNEFLFFLRNFPIPWFPVLVLWQFRKHVVSRYAIRRKMVGRRAIALVKGLSSACRAHWHAGHAPLVLAQRAPQGEESGL